MRGRPCERGSNRHKHPFDPPGYWAQHAGFGVIGLQDFGLDAQQVGFDTGRAADAPEQRGKAQHEFALDRGTRVVVGDDIGFKAFVIFDVFEDLDHGFGGQAMARCVAPRPLFAGLGSRAGAFKRIAPVGLDFPKAGHRAEPIAAGRILRPPALPRV
jgi:hypothetical protein